MRKPFLPAFLTLLCLASATVALADMESERRQALHELQQRADSGDAKALYDLGVLNDTGYDSIPVDSLRSSMLYRLSAEKGYVPAQSYLGFRYFNGEAIRQDVDSALFWMAKAAGSGDVKAANNLGFLLANSDKVSRDYPQAIYWLQRAADAGLPSAQANLADLLRQGLGTEPDTLRAVTLYNKAIEGGLIDASLKLLNMMGPVWERLSAESALSLGKYYYLHGAPNIGVVLFENAAHQGNIPALALLGDAYSRALGTDYDYDRSLGYFLRAAFGGNPSAQFVVAELLDMFPDALTIPIAEEVISEYFGAEEPSEAIYDPRFWYEQAAYGGVSDAESAAILLLE